MNADHNTDAVVGAVASHMKDRFDGHIDAATGMASRSRFIERAGQRKGFGATRAVMIGLSLAAFAIVVGVGWPRSIKVTASQMSLQKNGEFTAGLVAGNLAFSDGSQLDLTPGSAGQLGRLDDHGADVRVLRGHVELSVAKRKGARWSVLAGPYKVRVTGTQFNVDWDAAAQRFAIHMIEGHVFVEGPGILAPKPLSAGESLFLGPKDEQPFALPQPVLPAIATTAAEIAAPSVAPRATEATRAKTPAGLESHWAQLVAKGQYKDVLADAQRHDVKRFLARGSLGELAALADAARYGGDGHLARLALQSQRTRFAKSERAVLAAYLLGRLAEDAGESAQAVVWYDRYLQSPGPRPLAEESLGRKMLSLKRAGRQAQAVAAANEYKQRYPHGSFADAASGVQSMK
jgi:hypothetical protein